MFDHVTLRVANRSASERFYRTVLTTLGIEPTHAGADLVEWDDFSIVAADAERPPTRQLQGYFAAYVLAPDGTNVESVLHERR